MSKVATFLPINGFIAEQKLWLEGQVVLINPKYLRYKEKESFVKNSYRLFKLYSPKHIKHRTLIIKYDGESVWEVELDSAGYFRITLGLEEFGNFDKTKLSYFMRESKLPVEIPSYSKANIYEFPKEGKFVVSDVDDTVLVSHANNKFRKFKTLLSKGAFQRRQVEAMNTLYQHLSKDYGFIYLSNSEMNLYPLIKNFLKSNNFPNGPLFLREYKKLKQIVFKKYRYYQTKHHKQFTMQLLLRTFTQHKFVLVGDSGQKDPQTYYSIAREFPDQIEKIYIREIKRGHRKTELQRIQKKLEELNIRFEVFHTGQNLINE